MPQEARICVFAGHTGGHLFPALAFAERFKNKFPKSKIFLLTSAKARPVVAAPAFRVFEEVEILNEFPFSSGISLRTLRFLLELTRAFFLSACLLSKIKPDLCVGFGSYVSYPGMKLAGLKKIPTLIHEQNQIPGKATQRLAGSVDCVAVTFPVPGTVVHVGLPIRLSLYEAAPSFQRAFMPPSAENPLRLLVTGGSQGAHRLNEVLLASFSALLPAERQKIAVTHITGAKDFGEVTEKYRELAMHFKTYPFYENMQDLYRESDLAITRAGANTLFELALFGLPAIVVPFPHAAEGHQEANARYFEACGAVVMKKESELTPEWLREKINQMSAPEIRERYSRNLLQIAPQDAAVKLVDLAEELLAKEKICV